MCKSNANLKRIAALRKRLTRFDYLCSGNLRSRYAACGTKNCSCRAKPPALHGPYYYWSRLLGGKVVQRVLSPQQAGLVARAIKNYRQALKLLRKWEVETAQIVEAQKISKR